jgi:hypothetical protein
MRGPLGTDRMRGIESPKREFSLYIGVLVTNVPIISPPKLLSNWTGVNSYEGFWSQFNAQYTSQHSAPQHSMPCAANEHTQALTTVSTDGFSPASTQFAFTNTLAPNELIGSTQKYDLVASNGRMLVLMCRAGKPFLSLAANRESC